MKLYLAYGANTNISHMSMRCPDARYVCNVTIHHHRLVFRGVADVVARRGAKVTCALWLISEADEAALDRFEGFPHLYVKRYLTTHVDGRRHRMMMYVMRNQHARGQQVPPTSYEQTLREGYADCGMKIVQIDKAIERARNWMAANPIRSRLAPEYRGKWHRRDQKEQQEQSLIPPYRDDTLFVDVNDDDAVEQALLSIRETQNDQA